MVVEFVETTSSPGAYHLIPQSLLLGGEGMH
jgi:hypothetical protein